MVDLRSLEVFFWVVKLGGFGRAAERLHMTQPAVSGRISQIEERFQVRLLDRTSHRTPTPTQKGLELFAYAERMLSLHAEMVTRLTDPAAFSGVVRIGAAETLVHTLLGRLIHQLHERFPRVTPEIVVDISPNLQTLLLSGELDVALLLGPLNEPKANNVALCDYALGWVASPKLELAAEPLELEELVRWPIPSYARGTQPHADIAALFRRPEFPTARIFASSSLAAVIRMAIDGIGIGVLPLAVVESHLSEGTLQLLNVKASLPALRFTASYIETPGSGLAQTVAELAGAIATP